MLRYLLTGVIFIAAFTLIFAQKSPIKWGKIPPEDLAMRVYEADTLAGALVLCDYGEVTFDVGLEGPIYRFERHRRIKILNQRGFGEGDVTIPYYGRKGNLNLKAQIFQPDGSVTEISKKEIFDEQIYEYYHSANLAFPNISEGAVLEYEYSYTSPSLSQLPTWYFQENIPIRWSELRVTMIEWFKYARLLQGQTQLSIVEDTKENLNIKGNVVLADKSRYVGENMPALRPEPFVTTMNDYYSKIRFQLKGVNIPGAIDETYMTSWSTLARELMDSEYFGIQIKKANRVKEVVEAIKAPLEAAKTQLEKANIVYTHLLKTVEWDGTFDYTCDVGLDKAYDQRKANSAELNLMFLAILKTQGITTYPVLISTRSHGITYPAYPFTNQFNHVLVCAVLDEKVTLIDLEDQFLPMGLLREESLNKSGLLIMDDFETSWVDIGANIAKDILFANLELKTDGTIVADVKVQSTGYSAISERELVDKDSEGKFWVGRFESYSSATVSECTYSNFPAIHEPLKGSFKLVLPEAAQVVDDFIYFSPVIYSNFDENPFKLEKRTFPIEIPYPLHEDLILNIKLPEGYALESKPEQISANLPDDAGKFTYMMTSPTPSQLQVVIKIKIDKLYYEPASYEAIRGFFDLISEKVSEQLVLKKI